MTRIQCSGISHPAFSRTDGNKPSKKEAQIIAENGGCREFIEVENPSPAFRYLCRYCSPVAAPPPNTFAGKQFDKGLSRGASPDPGRQYSTPEPQVWNKDHYKRIAES
jgi:hypothetical protein